MLVLFDEGALQGVLEDQAEAPDVGYYLLSISYDLLLLLECESALLRLDAHFAVAVPESHHRQAHYLRNERFQISEAVAALDVHADVLILELRGGFVVVFTVDVEDYSLLFRVVLRLLPLPEHLVNGLGHRRVLLVDYIHAR